MRKPRRSSREQRIAMLLTQRSMLALELSVRRKEMGLLRESLRELQCEMRRVNLEIIEAHYHRPKLTLIYDRDRAASSKAEMPSLHGDPCT
ncbi:MAG: hypothetical protein ACFCUJ_13450 [Thiotrichales bacterium]